MDDAKRWFHAQPFVTKWLTVASLLIPLFLQVGLFPVDKVIFHKTLLFKKFYFWTIFTAPFVSLPSLGYLFGLVMRYQYSLSLETERFVGKPADYLIFLLFCLAGMCGLNCFVGQKSLWDALTMCIVYLWSKDHSDVIVRYMFGIQFKVLLIFF
jgi:hypothetical protein